MGIDQLVFPGFVWVHLYNTVMVVLSGREKIQFKLLKINYI